MYLCSSLNVLQVAGDEAGLLLVGVRHCGVCKCGLFVCRVLLCACSSKMYVREKARVQCSGQLY
jgi:hypothetical protein